MNQTRLDRTLGGFFSLEVQKPPPGNLPKKYWCLPYMVNLMAGLETSMREALVPFHRAATPSCTQILPDDNLVRGAHTLSDSVHVHEGDTQLIFVTTIKTACCVEQICHMSHFPIGA